MLSRSSTAPEPHLARVVDSTAGIVFLGTPHRGSPDFAAAGDWARTFVGIFGAETSPAILSALGLRTTDLERAQESFSSLWQNYKFRVKTFQEGLGLTGINVGGLGGKVVPDYSSSLGDQREHAETIQANHRDMCRFYGNNDPGYRQVSGELRMMYLEVEKTSRSHISRPVPVPGSRRIGEKDPAESSIPVTVNSFDLWGIEEVPFTETEKAFLTTLWYPNMNSRRRMVTTPADGTCNWLFEKPEYLQWVTGDSRERHNGLLQIKGSPGSGKSVLVKEVYRRLLQHHAQSGHFIAAFFFNSNGGRLDRSREGCLRSLLHQLLPQDREHLAKAAQKHALRQPSIPTHSSSEKEQDQSITDLEILEGTLRSFLFTRCRERARFILIDAVDECSSREDRKALCSFISTASTGAKAYQAKLNILMTSRNFPMLSIGSRPARLDMNQLNRCDISVYVEQQLGLGISTEASEQSQLLHAIVERARGVFLWVVLAVDGVIERWQEGASVRELLRHLDDLPQRLGELYSKVLDDIPQEKKELTLRVFQWAIFSARPLQLREWHDIMAFISEPTKAPPMSLRICQDLDGFTATDEQLERKIGALSRGLLEIGGEAGGMEEEAMARPLSQFAGAGSFIMNPGETRIIQTIHDSVNNYFKQGSGFDKLTLGPVAMGCRKSRILGHIAIMTTCLDYLEILELDALVFARLKAERRGRRLHTMLDGLKLGKKSHEDSNSGSVEWTNVPDEHDYPSPIGLNGVDIERWLAGVVPYSPGSNIIQDVVSVSPDQQDGGPGRSVSKRPSHHSVSSIQSQRLEAYPALLQYATDEFFTHASSCFDDWDAGSDTREVIRANMEPIIKRLLARKFSNRWLALREELHVIYPTDGSRALSFPEYLIGIDHRFGMVLPGKHAPPTPPTQPPSPVLTKPFDSTDSLLASLHREIQMLSLSQHRTSSDDENDIRSRYGAREGDGSPEKRGRRRVRGASFTLPPENIPFRRQESVGSFRSAASCDSRHSRHSRQSRQSRQSHR